MSLHLGGITCDGGMMLRSLKLEVREVWYSPGAQSTGMEVPGEGHKEFRSVNGHDWFHFAVHPRSGRDRHGNLDGTRIGLTEFAVRGPRRGPAFVRILPMPAQNDMEFSRPNHLAMLQMTIAPAVPGQAFNFIGETYISFPNSGQSHHRCFQDHTFKSGVRVNGWSKVNIRLPQREIHTLQQYDDIGVLTELYDGFIHNERDHPKIAFERLKDLITQTDTTHVESIGDQFFEFGGNGTERFFRWQRVGGIEEIHEQDLHTSAITRISPAGRQVQASLTHRKAQLYQNDETHSRF